MSAIGSFALAEEAIHLARLVFLAGRDKRIGFGSNKMQFHILYALCQHPAPGLTMTQLAEAMLVSPQQLSRLISGMEKNGLVKRKHDPANRRRVYVRALPAGLQEMESFIAESRDRIAGELEAFSLDEMRRLHECLVFIRRLLEKGILRHDTHNSPFKEEAINE